MALRWAGIGFPSKIGQLKPASSSSSTDSADRIPIQADRAFRIVTAHSGPGRKSVTFEQNPRSASSRITGHVRSESAVNLVRNTHPEEAFAPMAGCRAPLLDTAFPQRDHRAVLRPQPMAPTLIFYGTAQWRISWPS